MDGPVFRGRRIAHLRNNEAAVKGAPDRDPKLAAAWQAATRRRRAGAGRRGLLRRLLTTELTVDIEGQARDVFEVYADVRNHLGAHAFLQRIVTHGESVDGPVRTVDFTAFEAVPVAGIRLTSRIHVRQRIDREHLVYDTWTWSAPGVATTQRATFNDLRDGRTRVTEQLAFEAPRLLARFAATQGTAAHQATHDHLKAAIENGRYGPGGPGR